MLTMLLFFSLMMGGRTQIPLLLAGHHRPASEMPFKWRFAGVRMMAQLGSSVNFQWIQTSIATKPYISLFFRGRPDPLSPPLDLRMTIFGQELSLNGIIKAMIDWKLSIDPLLLLSCNKYCPCHLFQDISILDMTPLVNVLIDYL